MDYDVMLISYFPFTPEYNANVLKLSLGYSLQVTQSVFKASQSHFYHSLICLWQQAKLHSCRLTSLAC